MTDELGEKLRKIRVNKGFSQEYVSEQIDVSLSSYQRYEAGKVGIDLSSVVKLAELYKMTLDEIVNFGDPDFKVSEPKEYYLKKVKVSIMVELDGMDASLQQWIKKLTLINTAINQST